MLFAALANSQGRPSVVAGPSAPVRAYAILPVPPREFMARLAAQVPPPRAHQVRCHGLLASSAAWRPFVVLVSDDVEGDAARSGCSHDEPQVSRARRIAWSELLRRVLAVGALRS